MRNRTSKWTWFGIFRVVPICLGIASGAPTVVRDFMVIGGNPIPSNQAFWLWLRICAVLAFAVAWFQEHYKWRRLVSSRPTLKVPKNGCYVDTRQFWWKETAMVTRSDVSCLHLRVTNDPAVPTESSHAKDIGATITFFADGGAELFVMDARWGDTNQPGVIEKGYSTFSLLSVDLPIGRTREIDIAIKFPDEAECYGVNNESYNVPRFQHPRWRLIGTDLTAIVRVRGPHVDSRWRVCFKNPVNGPLEVVDCTGVDS